jgi:hypothetical protein
MNRRGVYRVLVCKPEGRSPLGRPRHRCEDNITMYLKEIGWEGVNWIGKGQVVGCFECGNKPSDSLKRGEFVTS